MSQASRISLRQARWALAYLFVVESALQFLLKAWSEVAEVVLFSLIVGGFAVATVLSRGVRGLLGFVTDTWTQRLAALFLAALALTFLWGDQTVRSMLALARLPTYLIIIALMVEALRTQQRMASIGWTVLVSICAVYALAIFEFVFGSAALALECADVPRCTPLEPDWIWPGVGSFVGSYVGDMQFFAHYAAVLNATVVGKAYGMNRLGMLALLAYGAGMAILLTGRLPLGKAIAGALVTFVLCGLILTGSRSGTLAVLGLCVFLIAGTAVCKAGHSAKTLVLANLAVFAAVGLFWLALPSGITSLDRLVTYIPPGRSHGFLDGVIVGRAGLVRREEKPVVVLRVKRVALDDVFEVQLRSRDRQGKWAVTEPITSEPEPIGDGASNCGDGAAACGDILLSWLGPADWTTPTYDYRLRPLNGEWSPWQSFVASPRYDMLDDLRLASSSDSYVVVLYKGALGVDSGRTRNWRLAWELFVENPLIGLGFRTFQAEVRQQGAARPNVAVGAHSGYLSVLAEAGLLGAIPFLGLLAFAAFVMLRANVRLTEPMIVWRIALTGVFMAMLAANVIDTHSQDRFFWLVLAFAAVLERWRMDANAELEPPRA